MAGTCAAAHPRRCAVASVRLEADASGHRRSSSAAAPGSPAENCDSADSPLVVHAYETMLRPPPSSKVR
jgi:hypothetical protein